MENFSKTSRLILPLGFAWFLIWVIGTANNPFFWDTVLTSKIAQYLFENGIGNLILPIHIDAGHPPFFQVYIMFVWKMFGKTLLVSHLAMIPFVILMVWSFYKISLYFFKLEKQIWLSMFFLCLETTLLAQSTLVSYDIVMVAFFLFGLYAILYGKREWLYWVLIVLSLTSIRSVINVVSLFCIDFYFRWKKEKFNLFGFLFPYLIGVLVFSGWHYYHYLESGWAIFSPSNEWSDQRKVASFKSVFKNVLVIGRNILDNGRIIFWVYIAFFFIKFLLNKNKINNGKSIFYIVLFIVLLSHILFFIPFTNPIGHRYLMPIFILGILVFVDSIFEIKRWKLSIIICSLMLILGHFIVYPIPFSNGWDSNLAYLHSIGIQQSIKTEMRKNKIKPNQVFTKFPLAFSEKELYLMGETTHFNTQNLVKSFYVLNSNISNDFQLDEIDYINKNFTLISNYNSRGIFFKLYKRVN